MENAPIDNLPSERSVGYINHELTIRGAKQIKAASKVLVKGKGIKLIEGKPFEKNKYIKLTEKGGKMYSILQKWDEKQYEIRKSGVDQKSILNLSMDKQRHDDLAKLKSLGGPFTNAKEVELYMCSKISDTEKNKRLYTEVRFAKNSSICYPKTSEIFRLKKNYKNLENSIYATNLSVYLNKLTCHVNMSLEDFRNALKELSN